MILHPQPARESDTRGSPCPGPFLEAVRLVRESKVGEVVSVISSDARDAAAMPVWAERAGHTFLGIEPIDGGWRWLVRKGR